ncbi:hypothetical protein [Pectobacterium carotovorum]|uniref:hypothetical protein n=1 Tax=Pectobacterium carotovorum TaxID=554 RepID=UPI00027E0B72|nr:hypothetical protein [Pectobacterium carotovorum]AFR03297.1 putative bacteriophage protein [Pectobacterium carotovorum subsp. carotovorum PCC21]
MNQPQLETDILLDQLVPSMMSPKQLISDIELMGIIRKARKIPDRHEGLLVEGLAKLIKGQFEEGVSLCERSIALNTSDHVSWLNFGVTVACRGHHSLQNDLLWRAMSHGVTEAYIKALSIGAFWLDIEMFEKAFSYLEKTGLLETSLSDEQRREVMFMRGLGQKLEFISPFAKLAMEIAENERLNVINSYVSGDNEDGYCYALIVDEQDPDKLLELNNLAVEMIIKREMQHVDCVTVFISEEEL